MHDKTLSTHRKADPDRQKRERQTFQLLLLIRWVSLLPVLFALALPQTATALLASHARALLLAILVNAALTLFGSRINDLIRRRPRLILLDLLFSGLLIWYTGAEASPFYLYSLTPILGAAFFFRIRGGLWSAGVYTLIYLIIVFLLPRRLDAEVSLALVTTQIIGFFVIALMVGYTAVLLGDLQRTHDELAASNAELSRRNRDLHLLQELTLLLQSSVDPAELQEYILQGLVMDMGYRRAAIGLYDEGRNVLTGWLSMENLPVSPGPERLGHAATVLLDHDDGPVAEALCTQRPVEVLDGEPATGDPALAKRLAVGRHYLVLPLTLRTNPLGVIIVDYLHANEPLSKTDRLSLERLAAHAGVALGSVRLCINRAQQQAVMAERNRIAVDLHDSISQVLYGLAYGLDACVQLLPDHPDVVRRELEKLQPVVADAQAKMRTAIFAMRSTEVTSDAFSARLHRHLNAICPARDLALRIELPGEFDRWPAETREQLYRVAQEAMTNAARHADARRIVITVVSENGRIGVRVEDDGQGFDVTQVDSAEHMGIMSMKERVQQLGGELRIESAPDRGTVVVASLPSHEQINVRWPDERTKAHSLAPGG